VRALEAAGVDIRAICHQEGLGYHDLTGDSDRVLSVDVSSAIWAHVACYTDDPVIGFRAAEHVTLELDNLLMHVLIAQPTLGDILTEFVEFQRLVAPAEPFSLVSDDGLALVVTFREDRLPRHAMQVQFFLGAAIYLLQKIMDRGIRPRRLDVPQRVDGSFQSAVQQRFGCPRRTMSGRYAWLFGDDALALRSRRQ
jgi:hypothetical protein